MLEAVIWDMDGVLVDSFDAHYLSWQRLAAEGGVALTPERFLTTFGRTSREIIEDFWPEASDARAAELDIRKEALYRDIVDGTFPAMDGAVEILDALHGRGIAQAIGTSGPPENVELVLQRLNRQSHFGATVTGKDVRRGKPDPEVFSLAAERLGVRPERCIVVEDAPAGIVAARRAGMTGVGLLSTGRSRSDFEALSPLPLFQSLRELDPDVLGALVASDSSDAKT